MRKKLAQQLRKKVYGDRAHRTPGWPRYKPIENKAGKIIGYQAQAHPLRQKYQKLKKLRRLYDKHSIRL